MKIARNCFTEDGLKGKAIFDRACDEGFSYIEITVHTLPENERDELIEYARSKGLDISLHALYRGINIIDTDIENKKRSISEVKNAIDLAAKHNISTVTFHPGRLTSEDEDKGAKWDELLAAAREIAEYAKEKRVYAGIENMEKRQGELVYTVDDLNRFAPIGEDNPYFGVTVDYVHFSTHGIMPDLGTLKLPLFNVHLSQKAGKGTHLPLTVENGEVDLRGVCEGLRGYGYDRFVVLEVVGKHRESREILEKI